MVHCESLSYWGIPIRGTPPSIGFLVTFYHLPRCLLISQQPKEDSRRWAHTFATLVAYLKSVAQHADCDADVSRCIEVFSRGFNHQPDPSTKWINDKLRLNDGITAIAQIKRRLIFKLVLRAMVDIKALQERANKQHVRSLRLQTHVQHILGYVKMFRKVLERHHPTVRPETMEHGFLVGCHRGPVTTWDNGQQLDPRRITATKS